MRRTEKLVELSRRDFCALAGCAGLVVAGCTDGSAPVVETGPIGDHPDAPQHGGNPDAPQQQNQPDARPGAPDASVSTPDASTGGGPACTGTATDTGSPPTSFTSSPKLIGTKYFVARDSGGLYAMSAKCTHEGATCQNSSGVILCPRHGAEFSYNGDVISGPVFTGLVHYALCILSNGNVGVTTQTVSQSTRMAV
jgi:nitrite reductase/ring-hydroxylating ferredoxin subunit